MTRGVPATANRARARRRIIASCRGAGRPAGTSARRMTGRACGWNGSRGEDRRRARGAMEHDRPHAALPATRGRRHPDAVVKRAVVLGPSSALTVAEPDAPQPPARITDSRDPPVEREAVEAMLGACVCAHCAAADRHAAELALGTATEVRVMTPSASTGPGPECGLTSACARTDDGAAHAALARAGHRPRARRGQRRRGPDAQDAMARAGVERAERAVAEAMAAREQASEARAR